MNILEGTELKLEQAEADLAAMTKERDNLRSLLEVTEDARSDWREEARKWEWVAKHQLLATGPHGQEELQSRVPSVVTDLLARAEKEAER